eukprot:TRINITY_DN2772_c0_g2_i1.p2 TRINITY_DN2772_c0_g2~~TRINITY_DN2772_c0_g2_i1.p2  ORF type:complete len:150 (-),score=25.68 TRINITY_DN2772_c0_g2_i1:499-948(-)
MCRKANDDCSLMINTFGIEPLNCDQIDQIFKSNSSQWPEAGGTQIISGNYSVTTVCNSNLINNDAPFNPPPRPPCPYPLADTGKDDLIVGVCNWPCPGRQFKIDDMIALVFTNFFTSLISMLLMPREEDFQRGYKQMFSSAPVCFLLRC